MRIIRVTSRRDARAAHAVFTPAGTLGDAVVGGELFWAPSLKSGRLCVV